MTRPKIWLKICTRIGSIPRKADNTETGLQTYYAKIWQKAIVEIPWPSSSHYMQSKVLTLNRHFCNLSFNTFFAMRLLGNTQGLTLLQAVKQHGFLQIIWIKILCKLKTLNKMCHVKICENEHTKVKTNFFVLWEINSYSTSFK